jgi:hypothetical protein
MMKHIGEMTDIITEALALLRAGCRSLFWPMAEQELHQNKSAAGKNEAGPSVIMK